MSESSNPGPEGIYRQHRSPWILFILRNVILVLLAFIATLHFKGSINLVFTAVMLACALLLALVMQAARLRLPACLLLFLLSLWTVRLVSFALFELSFSAQAISDADFLFFNFDRDFWPALVPGLLIWLFNLLALRYQAFITLEAGINGLLILTVFITEAGYNITLFHPTLFALILALLILLEIAVLMVHWTSRRPRNRKIKQRLSPVYALLIIPLLLLFLLQYLMMQKYNTSSAKNRGGLMESTLFRFDFSKYIKLESEIKLSDELVMLMRKNGPASRILIRRFVLSAYSPARGFYQSREGEQTEIPVIVPDAPLTLPDPGYTDREDVEQEYFFINLDPTSLVALNYPVKIIPLKNWDASSFLRIYRVSSRVAQKESYSSAEKPAPDAWASSEYNERPAPDAWASSEYNERPAPDAWASSEQSERPAPDAWASSEYNERPAPELPPDLQRFYSFYAEDTLIRELAEEVTAGQLTYTDKVLAIRDYLHQNYLYSLKPGLAGDGNQLHYFLFESHKGYCSYFAFAMALMCRSLGIPARVAVGFATLPEWEVLNFYEIRANQAHAWVEVYFGEQGWLEFDPTTDLIAPGEDLSFMTFQLSDKLTDLIGEILGNQDKLIPESPWEAETRQPLPGSLQRLLKNFNSFLTRTWFFLLPLLYTGIILTFKLRNYLAFHMCRRRRTRTKYLFRHTVVFLYNLGWIRSRRESIKEYALRLDQSCNLNLEKLTAGYLKAVFAPEYTDSDYREFLGLYRAFKRAYNSRVHLFRRLMAFLNPLFILKYKDFIR